MLIEQLGPTTNLNIPYVWTEQSRYEVEEHYSKLALNYINSTHDTNIHINWFHK